MDPISHINKLLNFRWYFNFHVLVTDCYKDTPKNKRVFLVSGLFLIKGPKIFSGDFLAIGSDGHRHEKFAEELQLDNDLDELEKGLFNQGNGRKRTIVSSQPRKRRQLNVNHHPFQICFVKVSLQISS